MLAKFIPASYVGLAETSGLEMVPPRESATTKTGRNVCYATVIGDSFEVQQLFDSIYPIQKVIWISAVLKFWDV